MGKHTHNDKEQGDFGERGHWLLGGKSSEEKEYEKKKFEERNVGFPCSSTPPKMW